MKDSKRIEVVLPCNHAHGLNSGPLPANPIPCSRCNRRWYLSLAKSGEWLFREVCKQNKPLTVIA